MLNLALSFCWAKFDFGDIQLARDEAGEKEVAGMAEVSILAMEQGSLG